MFSTVGLNLTSPTHFGDLLKLVNSKTASVICCYAVPHEWFVEFKCIYFMLLSHLAIYKKQNGIANHGLMYCYATVYNQRTVTCLYN